MQITFNCNSDDAEVLMFIYDLLQGNDVNDAAGKVVNLTDIVGEFAAERLDSEDVDWVIEHFQSLIENLEKR